MRSACSFSPGSSNSIFGGLQKEKAATAAALSPDVPCAAPEDALTASTISAIASMTAAAAASSFEA